MSGSVRVDLAVSSSCCTSGSAEEYILRFPSVQTPGESWDLTGRFTEDDGGAADVEACADDLVVDWSGVSDAPAGNASGRLGS